MAALRRDEDGDVFLDRGPGSSDRILRVQIFKNRKVLESSVLAQHPQANDGDAIQAQPLGKHILQARNSIFDEELHSELHREARNLINQGVKCIGDTIQLPYEHDQTIEIDLVEYDEQVPTESGEEGISNAIAIALRMLLSHAHRQNLHRRSQPPPPILDTKPPRPVYGILKPILENIRHRTNLHACKFFLEGLRAFLHSAGLDLDVKSPTSAMNIPPKLSRSEASEPPATEVLLNALTSPLTSPFELRLPSQETSLKIDLNTNLLPPTLGTSYRSTLVFTPSQSLINTVPPTMQFSTLTDLEEHLRYLLTLELASLVQKDDGSWEVVTPETGSLSRTTRNAAAEWSGISIRIDIEEQSLLLTWQKRTQGKPTLVKGSERWTGEGPEKKSFMESVKDLASI